MTIEDVGRLTHWVLWATFAASVAFGAIVQRTGFCTMGAITDAAALGEWTRMRQWALAAATAMAGFAALVALGVLTPEQTLYASKRWMWLSALTGGAIFGFGMVLASGCVSKTLVRVGGGNLKSLVVMLVVGLSAFMTLKGLAAVARSATVDRVSVDFGVNASLGALVAPLLAVDPRWAAVVLGAAGAGLLAAWALRTPESRHAGNLLAGAGVGAAVLALWWITGSFGHVAEHPETLADTFLATNSTRAEGLSFVSPVAYALDWLMFYSDVNKHLTVGIVSVAGVLCGSAAVALARRSFRWEGFAGTGDLGHHLAGGALMGIGGVTALGCSIGQGVSGLSTLSLTSVTAVAAMVAGALGGLRYQEWRLERRP
jgi:uncharacterized protein